MFKDLLNIIIGPWGLATVLLVGTQSGRRALRVATKEAVKFGIIATEQVKELTAELREEASDVVAEVKEQREQEFSTKRRSKKSMVHANAAHKG